MAVFSFPCQERYNVIRAAILCLRIHNPLILFKLSQFSALSILFFTIFPPPLNEHYSHYATSWVLAF